MNKTIAVRSDWDISNMPFRKAKFTLKRFFSKEEIEVLKCGHIPQEMEDKWFWFMEENTLYAHRSWTGICVYIVNFDFETGIHHVTVNRSKKQYGCTDKKEDLRIIDSLLDYWVKPEYDYYNQWVNETVTAIEHRNNN